MGNRRRRPCRPEPFSCSLCYKIRVLRGVKASFRLAAATVRIWNEAQAMQLAAALSFYAIFSLAPLLLLVTMIGGSVLGPSAARGELVGTMQLFVGPRVAGAVQAILANASRHPPVSAGVAGAMVLLLAASGVFSQLKLALNRIWSAEPRKRHWALALVQERILAALATVAVILFLIFSAVLTTVLATLEQSLLLPHSLAAWKLLNFVVSLTLLTALVATIFRFVSDRPPPRHSLWAGALFTALALSFGHAVLAFYLKRTSIVVEYGAAGSLVVVVLWVYFTSLTLFFGAAFAQAESTGGRRKRR